MPKGISLHLGLNFVDPAQYEGWDGELSACEFDAKDMQAIAAKQGFARSDLLLTSAATSQALLDGIDGAARDLKSGDLFWLTYSGHGGQVPDINGKDDREADRMDETWCLYDRQVIDDELYALWGRFKSGVRILVLSDSCHSGTAIRDVPPFVSGGPRRRAMPRVVGKKVYTAHRALYDDLQTKNVGAEKARLRASVVLISGCMDNQFSMDGTRNGLFTEKLKKVWNNGKFSGGLRTFRDQIVARMPEEQTPNYFKVGKASSAFEAQKPFTI